MEILKIVKIREHSIILGKLANKFSENTFERDELFQVFRSRIVGSLDKFLGNPKIVSWLYILLKNIYSRKLKRKPLSDIAIRELSANPINYNPKSSTATQLNYRDILQSVELLSEEDYIIISMYVEGFKYYEIASYLSIDEDSIKARVITIRSILRNRLNQ